MSSHGAHCGTECAWNVSPYFIPPRPLLQTFLQGTIARSRPLCSQITTTAWSFVLEKLSGGHGRYISAQILIKFARSGVSREIPSAYRYDAVDGHRLQGRGMRGPAGGGNPKFPIFASSSRRVSLSLSLSTPPTQSTKGPAGAFSTILRVIRVLSTCSQYLSEPFSCWTRGTEKLPGKATRGSLRKGQTGLALGGLWGGVLRRLTARLFSPKCWSRWLRCSKSSPGWGGYSICAQIITEG